MKTFSLDEANLLLPQIIPLLEKIRIYTRQLRVIRVQESINRRSYSADGNMIATPTNEQSSAAQTLKINECIKIIEAHGVLIKDLERGLIDFYHFRNAKLVLLCYLLGEESVRYWHDLDTGFQGRNLI